METPPWTLTLAPVAAMGAWMYDLAELHGRVHAANERVLEIEQQV